MLRWLLILVVLGSTNALGQPVTLHGIGARLVSCRPVTTVPCFQVHLAIHYAQSRPAGIAFPSPEKLAGTLTVTLAGRQVTPFYARVSPGEDRPTLGTRTTLILVDVSGSMNTHLHSEVARTRFQAAKAALQDFLQTFQPGRDRLAIVPFESHNVLEPIRSARFADTVGEAQRQLDGLPYPRAQNNTALYAAEDIALDTLTRQKQLHPQDEQWLVILTDGRNDVRSGDDPDLRRYPVHVEDLSEKIRTFGGQTLAIGFGDRREIDEGALHQMSKRVEITDDSRTLSRIFSSTRTLSANKLQLAFASPFPDLASIAGRDLEMDVTWSLPDQQYAQTDQPVRWTAGDMGVTFEGECDESERQAAPRVWEWMSVWRPTLIFVGFGAVLGLMWFVVPRYIGQPMVLDIRPVRSNQRNGPPTAPGPKPPVRDATQPTVLTKPSDPKYGTRFRDD